MNAKQQRCKRQNDFKLYPINLCPYGFINIDGDSWMTSHQQQIKV